MIIPHAEKRVGMAWNWGAPQSLRVPFKIYTMTEASDFKFGAQLGFAKTHHKTTPREKVDVALG